MPNSPPPPLAYQVATSLPRHPRCLLSRDFVLALCVWVCDRFLPLALLWCAEFGVEKTVALEGLSADKVGAEGAALMKGS